MMTVEQAREYDRRTRARDRALRHASRGDVMRAASRVPHAPPSVSLDLGGSSSQSVAWTPGSLANVRGWYRSDLLTLSGPDVEIWTDRSGVGNDLSSDGTNRPLFVASDSRFGGRPAVQADGALEWLRRTSFSFGANPVTEVSVWVVFAYDTFVSLDRVWSYGVANLYSRLRTATGNKFGFVGPSGGESVSTTTLTNTTAYCFGCIFSDTADSRSIYNKAALEDSDAEATAGPADGGPFALFASTTGTITSAVSIAEVIVQRGITTSDERTQIAGYVADYYGL